MYVIYICAYMHSYIHSCIYAYICIYRNIYMEKGIKTEKKRINSAF